MAMKNDDLWKKMTTPVQVNVYDGESFQRVKARFDAYKANGTCVKCPLSGTLHNMPYRRSISKGMARALMCLHRIQVLKINDGTSPRHFSDFCKLKYWGLIEKNQNGHWDITQYGIDFAEGKAPVQKYAIIVNDVRTEFMGHAVAIHEILNK